MLIKNEEGNIVEVVDTQDVSRESLQSEITEAEQVLAVSKARLEEFEKLVAENNPQSVVEPAPVDTPVPAEPAAPIAPENTDSDTNTPDPTTTDTVTPQEPTETVVDVVPETPVETPAPVQDFPQ